MISRPSQVQRKLIAPLCTGARADYVLGAWPDHVHVSCVIVLLLFLLGWNNPTTGQAAPPLYEQIVGQEFTHNVQEGDSLASIGARFGISVDLLAANNNLSPSALPEVGKPLFIDNRHIVVNGLRDGDHDQCSTTYAVLLSR